MFVNSFELPFHYFVTMGFMTQVRRFCYWMCVFNAFYIAFYLIQAIFVSQCVKTSLVFLMLFLLNGITLFCQSSSAVVSRWCPWITY